jgi:VanZ family protein
MPQVRTLLIFNPRYRKPAFRAAFAIYAAVLVFGSLPGARAEVGEYASGLLLHALTYGMIALLLFNGTAGGFRRKAASAFLTVAAMGAGDEWIQSFFPYRTASAGDWLVDVGAAFLMCVVLYLNWPKQAYGVDRVPQQLDTSGDRISP